MFGVTIGGAIEAGYYRDKYLMFKSKQNSSRIYFSKVNFQFVLVVSTNSFTTLKTFTRMSQ
mgnify:CR=1 FL=1